MEEGELLRPVNVPLHVVLQDKFFRDADCSNISTRKNGASTLESLVTGAVVLASHREKFYGVKSPEFVGRFLYEMDVVADIDTVMNPPSNHDKNAAVIPFLSPPNREWPPQFLQTWNGDGTRFAAMYCTANTADIDFSFHSRDENGRCALSGACKDQETLTLSTLKEILESLHEDASIHLVMVRKLKEAYFVNVAPPVCTEPTPTATMDSTEVKLQDGCLTRSGDKRKFPANISVISGTESNRKRSCNVKINASQCGLTVQSSAQGELEAKDVIVQNEESKIKGKTESPFDFLKRVKLEFADFYCVSERGELQNSKSLCKPNPPLMASL
ncbi:Cleavage and polyadenylation specificity factor subunit 4 [Phytophthora nicotianae]|nr:Cleavage and polyadenylation specificity factor subunit 4 [Phytophthora nicotianae]